MLRIAKGTVDDFRRSVRVQGGECSDGPIRGFKSGWAVAQFQTEKAHYMNVSPFSVDVARTRCGQVVRFTDAVPLLGEGNVSRCKRCVASTVPKDRR